MMSCSLKLGVSVSGSNNGVIFKNKSCQKLSSSLQFNDLKMRDFEGLTCQFLGQSLVIPDQKRQNLWNSRSPLISPVQAQASFCTSKAMRWWEKTLKHNMEEIHSAQQLVDALNNASDKLVIVDFYSPGCGGCRSLHPKICQLAEQNPDAIFLQVNYEKLKPMCHALHIHVLPFFRFYRGSQGKVCSFSCTISTINKFKTALAKHGAERCSLGPAKGLEESELVNLTSIGQLSQDLIPNLSNEDESYEELVFGSLGMSNSMSMVGNNNTLEAKEENNAMLV